MANGFDEQACPLVLRMRDEKLNQDPETIAWLNESAWRIHRQMLRENPSYRGNYEKWLNERKEANG